MAIMVLVDLMDWFYWAPELLSDQGLSPRVATTFFDQSYLRASIYFLVGSSGGIRALLSIQLAAAVLLGLGVFPRLAAMVGYLMYMSLHHRLNFPSQASDIVIRSALFWMVFLPVGEQFVWKTKGNGHSSPPRQVVSGASIGLLVLVFGLYFGAGVFKVLDQVWMEGLAVYFALVADVYPSSFGEWLIHSVRDHVATFSQFLTFLVVATELIAPCALVLPWKVPVFRTAGVLILSVLQFTFSTFLRLGLFSAQCWVVLLGLLPSGFWKKPPEASLPWKASDTLLAGLVSVLLICSGVQTVGSIVTYPRWLEVPFYTLGMGGYWPMFTRLVEIGQTGYEIRAHLQDGSRVDLFRNGAPLKTWSGPDRREDTAIFNQRSLSAYRHIMSGASGNRAFIAAGKFHCKQWNERAAIDKRAIVLEFVFYRRDMAPYYAYGPTQETIRYRWPCSGADAL